MNVRNTWIGCGRIANDLEVKVTESGKHVLNMRIAIDDGTKESPKAMFLPVEVWERYADTIAKYFRKGDQIIVSGRVVSRKVTDRGENRERLSIVLESFEFGEKKKEKKDDNLYPSDVTGFDDAPWLTN